MWEEAAITLFSSMIPPAIALGIFFYSQRKKELQKKLESIEWRTTVTNKLDGHTESLQEIKTEMSELPCSTHGENIARALALLGNGGV